MKLDILTMKDLKCFLTNEFEDTMIINWDSVAKKVMEWTEARQKKENEEKVDKWFESLPKDIKLSMAENLWYELSLEDKMLEYTAE